jgi:hypothetical protein
MGGDGALWQLFFCIGCVAAEPLLSSGNSIQEEGAVAFARALEKNSTLNALKLYCEFVFVFF